MTPAEVLAARPGARSEEPRAGNTLKGGSIGLVREDGLDIAGILFTASMYFRDGKLSDVHLSVPKNTQIDDPAHKYDQIVESLTAKYGKPTTAEKDRSSSGPGGNATWLVGDVTIKTFLMTFPTTGVAFINISYSRAAADRSKNL